MKKAFSTNSHELTFIYAIEFHENFALCRETFDTYMIRLMEYELSVFPVSLNMDQ